MDDSIYDECAADATKGKKMGTQKIADRFKASEHQESWKKAVESKASKLGGQMGISKQE
jgi:hypothetical protein